jgi:demethylmenaquinone methyltransferase / 2-methoxy-6-polyprenyl-1,4-benzoquinol methylase
MSASLPHDQVVPFKGSELNKKGQVAEMFNAIASRYDFMNRFLSAGIDVKWRKKAIRELKEVNPKYILDVATGTADVAIFTQQILKPDKIVGIDISEGMLAVGSEKLKKLHLQDVIELQTGDSETIKFPDCTFDAITVAFGVRNFQHLKQGLAEMLRVLKPGGKLVVLEFSRPKEKGFKFLYNIYMKLIAPGAGRWIARNKDAYKYLNDSVQVFPERQDFVDILNSVGFSDTSFKTLSLGICSIYCGRKK